MIIVYRGESPPSINLTPIGYRYSFDKDTPSFLPDERWEQIKSLSNKKEWQEYNPNETYNSVRRPIYVNMPAELNLFLGALHTLSKIKEYFPLNPIHVFAQKYGYLLPNFVEKTDSNGLSLVEQTQHYRIYDLRYKQNKELHYSDLALKTNNPEQVTLRAAGLFRVPADKKNEAHFLDIPILSNSKQIGIIGDTLGIDEALMSEGYSVTVFSEDEVTESNIGAMNVLGYFISVGVNDLGILSNYLNMPTTFVIRKDGLLNLDSFKRFPNCNGRNTFVEHGEEFVKDFVVTKVKECLGEPVNGGFVSTYSSGDDDNDHTEPADEFIPAFGREDRHDPIGRRGKSRR